MPTMPASAGTSTGMKRKARFFAAHEEHIFADARAHRIGGDDDAADRLARRRHRLHEQQRHAVERVVLDVQHDVSDDATELHMIVFV